MERRAAALNQGRLQGVRSPAGRDEAAALAGASFPDFETIIIERWGAANSEPGMNRKQRRARSARPAVKDGGDTDKSSNPWPNYPALYWVIIFITTEGVVFARHEAFKALHICINTLSAPALTIVDAAWPTLLLLRRLALKTSELSHLPSPWALSPSHPFGSVNAHGWYSGNQSIQTGSGWTPVAIATHASMRNPPSRPPTRS